MINIFVYCLTGECEVNGYPINKKELDNFIKCYNELLKIFTKEQVNIGIYSNDFKYVDGVLIYITLEELINGINFE